MQERGEDVLVMLKEMQDENAVLKDAVANSSSLSPPGEYGQVEVRMEGHYMIVAMLL